MYHADVGDAEALARAFRAIEEQWSSINGVIHAAAATSVPSLGRPLTATDQADCEEQFAAKVYGTLALDQALGHRQLDFCIMFSSLAATLGGVGLAAYAAANSFMDHFVIRKNQDSHTRWVSAQWDHWAVDDDRAARPAWPVAEQSAITPAQGKLASDMLVSWTEDQALVAASDLKARLERWSDPVRAVRGEAAPTPAAIASWGAPEHLQEQLTAIWEEQLGRRPIDPHANFFELGGDSLKALSIIAKIQKVFARKLELSALFSHPTIAGLLPLLEQRTDAGPPNIPRAAEQPFYPLCSAQTRLFVLNQLRAANTSYNLPQVFLVEGQLDRDRLETCLRALAERHEALRASFHLVKGRPVQRIHDHIEVRLASIETNADGLEPLLHTLIRPFALDTPPLFRAALVKYAERQFALLFDFHHIITDGVSLHLFFQELAALYKGQPLASISLRYRDYCVYERSLDRIERYAGQRLFWSEQLAGALPVLELPTDFARKEQLSYAGATIAFALDEHTSQGISALIARHRTTGFIFFLALMNIWLAKLSGQDDIVIGTPIQGRNHPDIQTIFGHFVDVLPLRNAPARELPFDTFLAAVTEQTVRAFENQDVSFAEIVDLPHLKWPADRNPLFDTMIVMQQQHPPLDLPEMAIKLYDYRHRASKFDLTLEIAEQDGQFHFALEYCTDLFREQTMTRYIEYFTTIIDQVLADARCPIADIRLSTAPVPALARSNLEFDWDD